MYKNLQRGVSNQFRRWTRSPFITHELSLRGRSSRHGPIIHCTYHKMGTKWFTSVLAAVADHYGLSFQWIDNEIDELNLDSDMIVLDHSDLVSQTIEPCNGSHLVRDFRDVVISGYFYHLWTNEEWAQIPAAKYGNVSYKQHLNSLSKHDGLLAEIERLADYSRARGIRDWDFKHPNFLELKYESVFGNEEQAFRALFRHYGFTEEAIDVSTRLAATFSFNEVAKKNDTRQKSHTRSGRSGQWLNEFDSKHKESFKEQLGDLLIMADYEKSNDW